MITLAQNAIFLDEQTENGRPFKARFLQAGLVKYDFGVCLLKKETIDKFVDTFMDNPVIIGHKDIIYNEDKVGEIQHIWFSAEDGWFWCSGVLTSQEAIDLIQNGYSVSCQYRITNYKENRAGRLHNGNPYDKEILDGVFEHLAIVKNPRYEEAMIAVNAIIDKETDKKDTLDDFTEIFYEALTEVIAENCLKAENERWITIHPHGDDSEDYRRLKLEDGETLKEAIDRVYKKENTEQDKKTKDQKPQGKEGLLPSYASAFFEKKEKREAAKEKWQKILAELQTKAETDKKFIEFKERIDAVFAKMREIKTYNAEYQALIYEKNKIQDEKNAYAREFYKEAYAAQDEYSNLNTSEDKKDIIQKMSADVKKQINKISARNDNIVKQINKIDTSRFAELKKEDEELLKQQTELSNRSLKLSWDNPERKEIRTQFEELAKRRGEIKQEKRELEEKTAQEVSKILKVQNGINLNTHCSAKMQPITDKLKKCLDGVIPENNFNNAEMTVRGHNGRAYHSGSTINISANDDIGTAIHETMHHLEEHSEHVLMNSLAFAISRTEGEKQASLKRLTGLSYKSNEVCKKDNFFNPYCGKLYDVFGGREKTFSAATASEIMSMGVQELFTNPKEFAKNDREYFNFVVANLQGNLWN